MKALAALWNILKKLTTPWAILIGLVVGFLFFAVILLVGAHKIGHSVWNALTAIGTTFAAVGTVGAVILALYLQIYLVRSRRPILELSPYELKPPHLRRVLGRDSQTGEKVCILYPLSIRLKNKGKTLAKRAQPLVTGLIRKIDGKWEHEDPWIPVPIRWGLDEYAELSTGRPTEERDLVPERSYIFNLGVLRTDISDHFRLNETVIPGNQPNAYPPGEFCIEVTAYAEDAEPITKYFHIIWGGGCTEDFNEVREKIRIFIRDSLP